MAIDPLADPVGFYEATYDAHDAERGARWRALGARAKAEHVLTLCRRAGLAQPGSVLEVGCGDGALLSELRARGLRGRLEGLEISPAAVQIARARAGIDRVRVFDGATLPGGERYELGVLSHVLEHVADPAALLRSVAAVCDAVVVEVPLEDNLSARRPSRVARSDAVGHVQRLSLASLRGIVRAAGLDVTASLDDALGLAVHLFDGSSLAARARWLTRASLLRVAPPLARRAFTVHHACLCVGARPR